MQAIAYWSSSLNDAEKPDHTTYRQGLSVVWALLLIRPYLKGTPFKIRTNYSLRWILNMDDAMGKLVLCQARFSEIEFAVVHRKGMKQQGWALSHS